MRSSPRPCIDSVRELRCLRICDWWPCVISSDRGRFIKCLWYADECWRLIATQRILTVNFANWHFDLPLFTLRSGDWSTCNTAELVSELSVIGIMSPHIKKCMENEYALHVERSGVYTWIMTPIVMRVRLWLVSQQWFLESRGSEILELDTKQR